MFTLRPAIPADVQGIFRVRLAVQENALDLPALEALGVTPASVTAMITGAPCAWVAVEAGEVIGFSMIAAEEGGVFATFVLREHEGRGVGRALLALAEVALFTQHPRIWLETAMNSRAAGFYRRHGWHEAGLAEIAGDIRFEKVRAAPDAEAVMAAPAIPQ